MSPSKNHPSETQFVANPASATHSWRLAISQTERPQPALHPGPKIPNEAILGGQPQQNKSKQLRARWKANPFPPRDPTCVRGRQPHPRVPFMNAINETALDPTPAFRYPDFDLDNGSLAG